MSGGGGNEPFPTQGGDVGRGARAREAVTTAPRRLEVGRIGEVVPRADGVPKTTGRFAYASDLWAAGMLWGHTVRSPHAHARIVAIDIGEALAMSGVHAVLTHDDVPGQKLYGLEFPDQPVLAIDRVRYFGEPVALVAAEHPEQARRAAEKVRVEYEPLEPVIDPRSATEREPLHPDRPTMGHGYRADPRPNVVRHLVIRHGDADAPADVSVEGEYEVGIQDQAFLGPESGLAIPDGEGGVDIHVATQWLHVDRDQVAPCLGLQPEQVRIHLAGVGGAFGGREDLSMQIHGALLALHTARPVKLVYGREESFVGHVHRHPARIWMKHRATRAGRLVSVQARILLDGGAYASSSTAVTSNAASFACGPYDVPNALIESTCVYTNNPPCGAMRGFGAVQTCFAAEAQMDKLAAALDIDPVELRLLNALAPGDTLPTGQVVSGSLPVAEVIRRAAALEVPPPEELPRDPIRLPGGAGNTTRGQGVKRGTGFAVGFKNICYSEGFDDFCAARVVLTGDAAEIHCAAAEVGQGVDGVIRQVARTELAMDDVTIAPVGTARVDSAGSASASRLTYMVAGAVQLACRAALEERSRTGAREIDVERVYHHPRTWPLDPETGQTTGERSHVALAVSAMRVVAEVDVELGLTRVVWIGTAQDVGKAINPQAVEGQIEGGTAQGLGLALMEEIQTRDGLITNASFTDYLIPTALDMPPVVSELIEVPEPDAPYGVKGVGEPPTVVSTAAIVSALRDATGRGLTRVPVRPDDIVGLGLPPEGADPADRGVATLFPQHQRRPAGEQQDPDHPRPVERDRRHAEPAEAVDRGSDDQIAGDHEPDRGGDPDLRRGERDREDDERAEDAAEPHPERLVDRRADAVQAAARDEQHQDPGRAGDERREADRLDRAHPIAEATEDRGLDRPGEAGRDRHHDCERSAAGHRSTLLGSSCSRAKESTWSARSSCTRVTSTRSATNSTWTSSSVRFRRTFRHGKIVAHPGRRGSASTTTPSSSFRTWSRSSRSANSPEFAATGKDAATMGIPFSAQVVVIDE